MYREERKEEDNMDQLERRGMMVDWGKKDDRGGRYDEYILFNFIVGDIKQCRLG